MDYEARTTRIVVLPKGEELFCERATAIEIDGEGAGEYVKVSQTITDRGDAILIDVAEWPHIRAAIDRMIGECRG
ncbi:MAG: hypothetical protein EOM22_12895 [Gammaproteobacteria bacterium]|nr:hypothetical protein [Gammaproteobacteria bacterium]